MTYYRILINNAGVYVKLGEFFDSQGGLTEEWGKVWEKVEAEDYNEARQIGIILRRKRFPDSHKTLGEV